LPAPIEAFPVGTRLRILPNHACATGAQHGAYHLVSGATDLGQTWQRFNGW
jgi:D-serine deaminase-like pyridoxal phosphate-dependent protein